MKISEIKIVLSLILVFLSSRISSQESPPLYTECAYDFSNITGDALPVPQGYSRTNQAVFVIPVVVHVIYNDVGGPENISDQQVLSAIAKINSIYSTEISGNDAEIEFRLASIDPNGNCTSGITRNLHSTAAVYFDSNNGDDCAMSI